MRQGLVRPCLGIAGNPGCFTGSLDRGWLPDSEDRDEPIMAEPGMELLPLPTSEARSITMSDIAGSYGSSDIAAPWRRAQDLAHVIRAERIVQ